MTLFNDDKEAVDELKWWDETETIQRKTNKLNSLHFSPPQTTNMAATITGSPSAADRAKPPSSLCRLQLHNQSDLTLLMRVSGNRREAGNLHR